MVSPQSFGRVFVGGGGGQAPVHQAARESIPILGIFDRRIGMDGGAAGLLVVLTREVQVVVERLAIHGPALGSRLVDRGDALLPCIRHY